MGWSFLLGVEQELLEEQQQDDFWFISPSPWFGNLSGKGNTNSIFAQLI